MSAKRAVKNSKSLKQAGITPKKNARAAVPRKQRGLFRFLPVLQGKREKAVPPAVPAVAAEINRSKGRLKCQIM